MGHSGRIRLAAQIAGCGDVARRKVDCNDRTRWGGIAFGGVQTDKGRVADDRNSGWFAVQHDAAFGHRVGGIGDIDQADRIQRAIAVNKGHAVHRRRDNFGRAFSRCI